MERNTAVVEVLHKGLLSATVSESRRRSGTDVEREDSVECWAVDKAE